MISSEVLVDALFFVADHLFEVAVEVTFPQDSEEPWDQLASSLLMSVKSLVCRQESSLLWLRLTVRNINF